MNTMFGGENEIPETIKSEYVDGLWHVWAVESDMHAYGESRDEALEDLAEDYFSDEREVAL